MSRLRRWLKVAGFWNYVLDGLAVLAAQDVFRVYRLQRPVGEFVVFRSHRLRHRELQRVRKYYQASHKAINPNGIVPIGPELDFSTADLRRVRGWCEAAHLMNGEVVDRTSYSSQTAAQQCGSKFHLDRPVFVVEAEKIHR